MDCLPQEDGDGSATFREKKVIILPKHLEVDPRRKTKNTTTKNNTQENRVEGITGKALQLDPGR